MAVINSADDSNIDNTQADVIMNAAEYFGGLASKAYALAQEADPSFSPSEFDTTDSTAVIRVLDAGGAVVFSANLGSPYLYQIVINDDDIS